MKGVQYSKILIIGGGVIGLSIARELHIAGVRDITVVDKATPGQEASWAAAGMLAPNAETEKVDDFYRFCSESNELYPEFANSLFNETGIDVGLDRAGTLQLAFDNAELEILSAKYHRQKDAGLPIKMLSAEEVLRFEPGISSRVISGISYPNDRQVDNRKLVAALVEYCRRNEIRVLKDQHISSVTFESGRATGACSETEAFSADVTILATGAWTSFIEIGGAGPISVDIKPIRGQMIAFKSDRKLLTKVIYANGCYLVPRADGRILVGATVEDVGFEKAVTDEAVEWLRSSAVEILPELADLDIAETWSGLRPRSIDEFPVIGNVSGIDNLFVATGHYRNGILLAPLTAKLITKKIVGNIDSNYLSIFSPERFNVKSKVRSLVN
jgi:glycine oxidase